MNFSQLAYKYEIYELNLIIKNRDATIPLFSNKYDTDSWMEYLPIPSTNAETSTTHKKCNELESFYFLLLVTINDGELDLFFKYKNEHQTNITSKNTDFL